MSFATLLWTAIGSGFVILATLLATARVGRGSDPRRTVVPLGFLHVAVMAVAVFLVLIGGALLAGPATRVLVVWLVVLLAVTLVCTLVRVRSTADRAPATVPGRQEVLPAVVRLLERADYHQLSLVRVAVSVDLEGVLGTALGSEAVRAVRDVASEALARVVPADAPVWSEGDDRVIAIVRQAECDLADWREEVETVLLVGSADQKTVAPSTTWMTASTDDLGYRLTDLEAAAEH